ncbi:MAG: hypothetical protein PHW69_09635 [Elusimicrobiaceae bacterium]|nr:hypothetical protein [Elusimicrobiaceae bacterium]
MRDLFSITDELCEAVSGLDFSAARAAYVYNPLDYARAPYDEYVRRYGFSPKKAVFLGMNPGPFGMAQTGIPFGEVSAVRDWLGISAEITGPPRQHPARPVTGFSCFRSEVSGRRLWGWAKKRFKTPDAFFKEIFVLNYCPLVFMEESGRNLTPDKLPPAFRRELESACDRALLASVEYFRPRYCVGIGAFAEQRFRRVLSGTDARILRLAHPSPASPAANRGWDGYADALAESAGLGVCAGFGEDGTHTVIR